MWARARRHCAFATTSVSDTEWLVCSTSTLRRTVWDGEQELVEVQVPGADGANPTDLENDLYVPNLPRTPQGAHDPNPLFGRVIYTHGLEVDQPLGLTRFNYVDFRSGRSRLAFDPATLVLHWNARGQLPLVTFGDGGQKLCPLGNDQCMTATLPDAWAAYDRPKLVEAFWQGTIPTDKRDASATLYRRARVYDPATGRFTQEDPIGLAGGVNLYGFANGDPASYSDPFGLCPRNMGGDGKTQWLGDCPEGTAGFDRWRRGSSGAAEAVDAPWEMAYGVRSAFTSGFRGLTTFSARQLTRWGWEGGGKHKAAIRQLATESNTPLTHVEVGGVVPTRAEAEQLIVTGGGRVLRVETHAPGGVSDHTYPHINYVTRGGTKATVRIQSLDQ